MKLKFLSGGIASGAGSRGGSRAAGAVFLPVGGEGQITGGARREW